MKNKIKYILIIFSLLLTCNCYYFKQQKSDVVEVSNLLVTGLHANSTAFNKERTNMPTGVYKHKTGKNNPNYKDGRTLKKYFCIACNKKISYGCAMYGKRRCHRCAGREQKILSGKNASRYKDGRSLKKYYCKDCGKKINWQTVIYGKEKCRKCYFKNKRRSLKKYFCKDCMKEINIRNTRCRKCSHIYIRGKNNPNIKGAKHWNWKNGITPLAKVIRNFPKYHKWRKSVFTRDNYTCQNCSKRGGYLEAHHKKSFKKIFKAFLKEYKQYSPIKDKTKLTKLAIKYKPFWEILNGKTLCKKCHKNNI